MSNPILLSWSLVLEGSPFTPPECRTQVASGKVFGRDGFTDGSRIVTSRIVDSGPDWIRTENGTTYKLGEIAADYVTYLNKKGRIIDPKHAGLTIPAPESVATKTIHLRSNTTPGSATVIFARARRTEDRMLGGRFFYTFKDKAGMLIEKGKRL